MEEAISPASSSQEWSRENTPNNRSIRKSRRHNMVADEDQPIECTGKSCQTCTTGLITDCVAVCLCPCAVIDIMLFTFFKVPYVMGRKWLKKKKKKRSLEKKRSFNNGGKVEVKKEEVVLENNVSMEFEFSDEEIKDDFSARFDAEEVWLELYQIGHLGFGRVSFSGIHPKAD